MLKFTIQAYQTKLMSRKSSKAVKTQTLNFGQRMKLLRYERMQRKLKAESDKKLVEDAALKEFPNTINTNQLTVGHPVDATAVTKGSKFDERSSSERALEQAIERIRESTKGVH